MKKIPMDRWEKNIQGLAAPYLPLFDSVKEHLFIEAFSQGENIVTQGVPIQTMRLLLNGKAKIGMIHENGTESIVDFLEAGEYIGDLTLLEVEREPKDVTALTACLCLSIPMKTAINVLREDHIFLLALSRYLAGRHLKRTWFYVKGLRYELKHRLAAYILMTECNGCYYQKHTLTAEFLGVSYRHLLYTFKQLTEEEILIKKGKCYEIDRERLKNLAKDIPYGFGKEVSWNAQEEILHRDT